jgi:hypothetical protein
MKKICELCREPIDDPKAKSDAKFHKICRPFINYSAYKNGLPWLEQRAIDKLKTLLQVHDCAQN